MLSAWNKFSPPAVVPKHIVTPHWIRPGVAQAWTLHRERVEAALLVLPPGASPHLEMVAYAHDDNFLLDRGVAQERRRKRESAPNASGGSDRDPAAVDWRIVNLENVLARATPVPEA